MTGRIEAQIERFAPGFREIGTANAAGDIAVIDHTNLTAETRHLVNAERLALIGHPSVEGTFPSRPRSPRTPCCF